MGLLHSAFAFLLKPLCDKLISMLLYIFVGLSVQLDTFVSDNMD